MPLCPMRAPGLQRQACQLYRQEHTLGPHQMRRMIRALHMHRLPLQLRRFQTRPATKNASLVFEVRGLSYVSTTSPSAVTAMTCFHPAATARTFCKYSTGSDTMAAKHRINRNMTVSSQSHTRGKKSAQHKRRQTLAHPRTRSPTTVVIKGMTRDLLLSSTA